MKDYRKTLASRIRALRLARGLSQEQLSDAAGVVRQSISFIEQGENWPNYSTLESLARALQVEPESFFSSDDPPVSGFERLPPASAKVTRGLEQIARKLDRVRTTLDAILTPAESRLLIAARRVAALAGDDSEISRAARLLESLAETLAKRAGDAGQVGKHPARRRR